MNMLGYSSNGWTLALLDGLSDMTDMSDGWMHRQPCSPIEEKK